MRQTLTILALALLTCACSTSRRIRVTPKHTVLHQSVSEAGETLTYALLAGREGQISVTREKQQKFDVATLGLRAGSINSELAKSLPVLAKEEGDQSAPLSVTPWNGLIVNRITRNSPAMLAGISMGDILLSMDGIALSAPEQLKELLDAFIEPGATVTMMVLEANSDDVYASEPSQVSVTLGTKQVQVSKSDTFQVDSDLGVFRLTGLMVGTLSDELASEIYGSSDPMTLVAGSLVGSPAYLAGFRSGDKVLECDGQSVNSYQDISRAVLARTNRTDIPADWFDSMTTSNVTNEDGDVLLAVEGPLGTHESTMSVISDIKKSSRTSFPIVWDYETDVIRTSWSFVDFIFQFGANYRSRYRHSSNRSPQQDTLLSIFPFGMFEFETTAQSDRYQLFWLFEFEDQH
ncbi:MAG: S1-C subfamily serine protease [Candidatus Paceibacteria bacterium]|jgi:S1-C subfamily serine protease